MPLQLSAGRGGLPAAARGGPDRARHRCRAGPPRSRWSTAPSGSARAPGTDSGGCAVAMRRARANILAPRPPLARRGRYTRRAGTRAPEWRRRLPHGMLDADNTCARRRWRSRGTARPHRTRVRDRDTRRRGDDSTHGRSHLYGRTLRRCVPTLRSPLVSGDDNPSESRCAYAWNVDSADERSSCDRARSGVGVGAWHPGRRDDRDPFGA